MKRILMALLATVTMATAQRVSVDVQSTTATDLYLYQVDQGTVTVDLLENRQALSLLGDFTFWYATNGLRSDAVVEIAVTTTNAATYVEFPVTADKFPLPTPGTRPWIYGVEANGKMLGDGRIYLKHRPATTNATLELVSTSYVDWSLFTNYYNTSTDGPYEFTAGFGWTTNSSGRLVLTSTAGTPAWEDVLDKPFTNLVDLTVLNLTGIDWSAYVTGTPWTAEGNLTTETDPVWTAASTGYYTRVESDNLFATGTPLYAESDPV